MLRGNFPGLVIGFLASFMIVVLFFNRSKMDFIPLDNKTDNQRKSLEFHPQKKQTITNILLDHKRKSLARLQDLIEQNASSRDPDLISLARDLMDPPSDHMVKLAHPIISTPQSEEILKVLQEKRNGFFVESGALDGERSSNTLYLEEKQGWSGLLVEMDPYFYTQLRGKSRRSWSINACVSPVDRPTVMNFKESRGGKGALLESSELDEMAVPCFPIETLLLALNTTHVDYWSLDVEGFELPILRTVPFDRLDITTLSVEYIHGSEGKEAYVAFMEENGYRVESDLRNGRPEIQLYVRDYIFVKNTYEASGEYMDQNQ